MSIWRWADYFCKTPSQYQITLGEGDTPLVRSRRIGPGVGLDNLYFKLETTNPTGSYKDRFAAVAIADMLAHGKTRSVGTSSGNTGSAVAAYCAASGLTCEIAIVETAPSGKLKQMLVYGAQIYRVKGMGITAEESELATEQLNTKANRPDTKLQISAFLFSPEGMAGVQTIAYELAEQIEAVDSVFVPAGGGGLTLAIARGFVDLVQRGQIGTSPAIHCVQPVGNNTMAGSLREGRDEGQPVECTSEISGLQVGAVYDAPHVIRLCRASGGTGYLVEDHAVWTVQRRLAREEGIFCEPAGAVALTGVIDAVTSQEVAPKDHIVCVVTGVGFKDPLSVERMIVNQRCPLIDPSEILKQ